MWVLWPRSRWELLKSRHYADWISISPSLVCSNWIIHNGKRLQSKMRRLKIYITLNAWSLILCDGREIKASRIKSDNIALISYHRYAKHSRQFNHHSRAKKWQHERLVSRKRNADEIKTLNSLRSLWSMKKGLEPWSMKNLAKISTAEPENSRDFSNAPFKVRNAHKSSKKKKLCVQLSYVATISFAKMEYD